MSEMAAVMTIRAPGNRARAEPTIRPRPPCPVSTSRRRRAVAAGLGVAMVLVAAQVAGALGDTPLAVPERRPAVSEHAGPEHVVVEAGDSLWSIAEELEPGADPRPVVDALAEARGGAPLIPGETIVWPG